MPKPLGPSSRVSPKVRAALGNIGRPAHYSEIAEVYREMFPNDQVSDHSIHAILGRKELGIVWAGAKGFYALAEWGYEQPSKTLHELLAEIVADIYARTQRPVSQAAVWAEASRHKRLITPESFSMALSLNRKIRSVRGGYYVPHEEPHIATEDSIDEGLRRFESDS